MSTNPDTTAVALRPSTSAIPSKSTPEAPQITPLVRQNVTFTDLPAEIRNQIYDFSIPSGERYIVGTSALVIARSFSITRQPGLTQANRQTRRECLAMFQARNTFYAFIDRLNFRPLLRWMGETTSSESFHPPPPLPPRIHLHIVLSHRMTCFAGLEELALAWRDLSHERVRVIIRESCNHPYHLNSYSSECSAVRYAMDIAEESRISGMGVDLIRAVLRNKWRCRLACIRGECSVRASLSY